MTSPNYALAIHTASPELGLAISNFAGDDRAQTWVLGRELSTHLHLHLAQFIQPQTWSDLAFIAVAKGPGGFTGTRLGMVTARTLAQQLNIPLFAVSTLAAIAHYEYASAASELSRFKDDLAIQMPAHRGEVYGAIYSIESVQSAATQSAQAQLPCSMLVTQLADSVLPETEWQQTLQTWHRPYRLVQAEGGLGATAESVLALAYWNWLGGDRPEWSIALPFYGQSPV